MSEDYLKGSGKLSILHSIVTNRRKKDPYLIITGTTVVSPSYHQYQKESTHLICPKVPSLVVSFRIDYTILLLVFKSLNGLAPLQICGSQPSVLGILTSLNDGSYIPSNMK